MKNAVLYYRVSTKQQGESGLGLGAQKDAVSRYLQAKPYTVIKELTEVKSSNRRKNKGRPKLMEAIKLCKEQQATLIVHKLDRLERNVKATAELIDSGVEFVCVDNPNITKFTLQILACVAEKELDDISQRTSAALQELKRQGKKLGRAGGDNLQFPQAFEAVALYRAREKQQAIRFAEKMYPTIAFYKQQGWNNDKVAEELNRQGHLAPCGLVGRWTRASVSRCIRRVK